MQNADKCLVPVPDDAEVETSSPVWAESPNASIQPSSPVPAENETGKLSDFPYSIYCM